MKTTKTSNTNRGKFTPEVCKTILAAIKGGNFRTAAASVAGIHPKTFAKWMMLDEPKYVNFRKQVEAAEANVEVEAVNRIIMEGHNEDVKWLAWWLERKCKHWNGAVHRWEIQSLQKQIKELKNIIHELIGNETAGSQAETAGPATQAVQSDR